MRAIGIPSYGSPDVLTVVELPLPGPGPGQVRIKVAAAAVNPADLALRAGVIADYMAHIAPPYIPGMDLSGHIDALGPDTTGFAVGARVIAYAEPYGAGGAQAKYVCVPVGQVAPLPDGVPLIEAASLPMNGLTAHLALSLMNLPRGASLAVTGATGTLGGYVVQLAKHYGLTWSPTRTTRTATSCSAWAPAPSSPATPTRGGLPRRPAARRRGRRGRRGRPRRSGPGHRGRRRPPGPRPPL
jgi:NADPH:quinone reductase